MEGFPSYLALPNRALAMNQSIAAATRTEPPTEHELDEYRAAFAEPRPFELTGVLPDTTAPDAVAILEICAARKIKVAMHPGLALQTCPDNYVDKWFVTFREPDAAHEKQWFWEASNSGGGLYRADEFTDFLARLDSPPTPERTSKPYREQQVPRDWVQLGGLGY